MITSELSILMDSAENYFAEFSGIKPVINPPFLKENLSVVLDYTGVVGITGNRNGCIYITASADLLRRLGSILLETDSVDERDIGDLIGEMANTICGNVKSEYGDDLIFSTPIIVEGNVRDIRPHTEGNIFIIPIIWETEHAFLVVDLE